MITICCFIKMQKYGNETDCSLIDSFLFGYLKSFCKIYTLHFRFSSGLKRNQLKQFVNNFVS
ncbi:hypothetical protein E4412_06360 [Leptospira interrogans]|nr:hypothetical protein E4412_06360 [Leptospira interrogans]